MQYPALMDLQTLKIQTEEAKVLPNVEGLIQVIKSYGLENKVDLTITTNNASCRQHFA